MRLVDFVDGEDNGNACSRCMVDSLDSLRHDVVVGGDDDDNNICHLCATGTHSGECLVTRSVEEGDMTSVSHFDAVGADVLRDAAGLAGYDVGVADIVEQRRLTVVDMTHDRNDRRTGHEIFFFVFFLMNGIRYLSRHIFGAETELIRNNVDGFGIETLVDRHHDTEIHTRGDDIVDRHVHHQSQVIGSDKLRDFEHTALCHFSLHGLALAVCVRLAFLLTPLDAFFQTFVFGGETCECLFHLLLYVLFAYLRLYLTFGRF